MSDAQRSFFSSFRFVSPGIKIVFLGGISNRRDNGRDGSGPSARAIAHSHCLSGGLWQRSSGSVRRDREEKDRRRLHDTTEFSPSATAGDAVRTSRRKDEANTAKPTIFRIRTERRHSAAGQSTGADRQTRNGPRAATAKKVIRETPGRSCPRLSAWVFRRKDRPFCNSMVKFAVRLLSRSRNRASIDSERIAFFFANPSYESYIRRICKSTEFQSYRK